MKRAAVALALAFAVLTPASAGAAVLYDQSATVDSSEAVSSRENGSASSISQAADDFTVPAGLPWSVTSIEVPGGRVSGDTMSVFVYLDAGGFPGPQVFSQAGIPIPVTAVAPLTEAFPVSGLNLAPGHYWLSLQVHGVGVWDWYPVTPVRGLQAVYRTSGTSSPGPCFGNWGRLSVPNCGLAGHEADHDLGFTLLGSVPALPAATHKCKKKKKKKKHHKKCKKKKHH
ncbi:MAG: hypothetical protein QOD60_1169 [Solirubrobacterales bacterium]|nr:hypothetical protein [Solirubrobacterales bacterium]